MLFREHRGSLDDAMKTCIPLPNTKEALVNHIKSLNLFDDKSIHSGIVVAPYGYDERIQWNTHIVTILGYGVIGFTNQNIV
jgi:hypothetical protein